MQITPVNLLLGWNFYLKCISDLREVTRGIFVDKAARSYSISPVCRISTQLIYTHAILHVNQHDGQDHTYCPAPVQERCQPVHHTGGRSILAFTVTAVNNQQPLGRQHYAFTKGEVHSPQDRKAVHCFQYRRKRVFCGGNAGMRTVPGHCPSQLIQIEWHFACLRR